MRALAVEHNVPIVSATQSGRSGATSSDPDMTDVSECIYINEEVQLKDGEIKKIGEVSIGDQITSQDGYKTVMLVHHRKLKDCVKLKTKTGKEIVVSKDHIFPTNMGRISVNTGLQVGNRFNTL
jgi:hypothetical protein